MSRQINWYHVTQDVRYRKMPLFAIVDHHNRVRTWCGDREEMEGCHCDSERVVEAPIIPEYRIDHNVKEAYQ